MKNILLLGIGGTGTNVVDLIHKEILSHGVPQGSAVSALILDTDNHSAEKQSFAKFFSLASPLTVKRACDMLDKEALREWFPVPEEGEVNNRYSSISLSQSNLWRKGAFLALNVFLANPSKQEALENALSEWINKDPYASFEVYVISSLAGACGSGCLIPLTLYVKRLLKERMGIEPAFYAALLGPDVHADRALAASRDIADRMRANAYATIRELNAIQTVATHGAGFEDVRFRLGSPLAPTGVLFDSADPRFHTPESAPFSHVYLHGRKVSHSIREHDESLAHFLYTLCGTDAAAYISYITSSAAALNNQSNRRAGLYSSVSFARMEHPVDALANYAAHAMVRDAVWDEWLCLHRAAEAQLLKKKEQARLDREIYVFTVAQYAQAYLDARWEIGGDAPTYALDRRLTAKDQVTYSHGVSDYVRRLEDLLHPAIRNSLHDTIDMVDRFKDAVPKPHPLFGGTMKKQLKCDLPEMVAHLLGRLTQYYRECDAACSSSRSLADRILPRSPLCEEEEFSLFQNLLCPEGMSLAPAETMLQLCHLRTTLATDSSVSSPETWVRGCDTLPESLLATNPNSHFALNRASAYASERRTDFPACLLSIANDPAQYESKRSASYVDTVLCLEDIAASAEHIATVAMRQLKRDVFLEVIARLDALIEGYRRLFEALADSTKDQMDRLTETTLHQCTSATGNTVYLSSDEESKKRFLQHVKREFLDFDLAKCHNAVGEKFFRFAYDDFLTQYGEEEMLSASSRSAHAHEILDTAVREFARAVLRSDYYESSCRKSVFEVIADSNAWNSPADLMEAFRKHLSFTTNPAKFAEAEFSSLSNTRPATGTIAMVGKGAADFLRQNANDLGLDIGSPQASTTTQNLTVVEDLFSKCGITGAEIAVLNNFPSGKIDVISLVTSLRAEELAAFIELPPLGERNCYSAYRRVISFVKEGLENGDRDRDLSNPHLGNALYEVSNLPYLNPNAYFVFPEEAPHGDIPPQ